MYLHGPTNTEDAVELKFDLFPIRHTSAKFGS